MKAIKSDSDSDSDEQKRSPGFSGKNREVTPSVAAAPGVTHPSDATASYVAPKPTKGSAKTRSVENLNNRLLQLRNGAR